MAHAYADDVVIMASAKFGPTINELLSSALGRVNLWCGRVVENVSPLKTTILPIKGVELGTLGLCSWVVGSSFSNQVKYLEGCLGLETQLEGFSSLGSSIEVNSLL